MKKNIDHLLTFFSTKAPFLSLYKLEIIDSFSAAKEEVHTPFFPKTGLVVDSSLLLSMNK